MKNLTLASALITGASSGIGLACARGLLANGVCVTGVSRSPANIEAESRFTHLACDLSNLELLSKALSGFPSSIGTLILNAGLGQFGGLEQFSHPQIQQLINTNLTSNLFLIKHYLPLMKRQGGGDMVIIGSESALAGGKTGSVYCATKFAMRGVAQSLRADTSNSNIRVHLINPGPVDTAFFEQLNFAPMEGQEFVLNSDDVAKAVIHVLQQPRHVVSEEVNLQPMKRSFKKNSVAKP